MKKKIKDEKYDNIDLRKKRLKIFKIIMVIFDIMALFMLIFEIINKEISYSSYIVLIICNIIVFITKVE